MSAVNSTVGIDTNYMMVDYLFPFIIMDYKMIL